MRKCLNPIVPLLVIAFCLMLAAPVYAGDGCGAAKAKVKADCSGKASTDAQGKSSGCKNSTVSSKGCSKPCSMPCSSKMMPAGLGSACKLTFGVAYMNSEGCASAVKQAIKVVDGVRSVAVDYRGGVADVEFDARATNSATVVKAVQKAGYHAQVGPYSEKEIAEFAGSAGTAK
jgi:copper chaperone CopZ